jgi:fructokinase
MRKVYTIGDCVLDVFFEDNKPVEAKPGGSFLNSSVSLGRLGVNVSLISELGTDRVGKQILKFLADNNVNTGSISFFNDTNSNLALAFLDDQKNADYLFYKTRKGMESCVEFPNDIKRGDIILFGSFLALKDELRQSLTSFLKYCRKNEAIIIYDPNFRTQHLPILDAVLPFIKENMALADIVKASNEDFKLICGAQSASEAVKWMLNFSNAMLVYTANKDGVFVYNNKEHYYSVPQIQPVSTVGAGDTFNASIAYYLIKSDVFRNTITELVENEIEKMIQIAILFSQEVCMRYDNFLPEEFARNYQ